mgnify:FL=1
MNIFVLDPDPTVAASYHCDQHLHKMILESAQMVSTAMIQREFNIPGLYKPTHINHPCTKWAAESNNNILWICELAAELDSIRQSVSNCGSHASMDIVNLVQDYLESEFGFLTSNAHTPFIFDGPAIISIRPGSVIDHYQQFYRRKHNNWLVDKGAGMTYKGRSVPDFMADLISPTT